jgi:type I restriction enzyme R subunit
VSPFSEYGTPVEIIELFGGREAYMQAIREIQRQLYA